MYGYIYLDENIAIHQPVTEAFGRNTNIPHDGDVWLTDFPFYRDGKSKVRRAVYIDHPLYGLIAIRVSSIKPNTRIGDYNYVIRDYLNNGFTKDVYLEGTGLAQLQRVKYLEYVGRLDPYNYRKIKSVLYKFIRERYERMFNAMDWLLYLNLNETTHRSGNNNYNIIQDEKDIEISRVANCIDIANVFHRVAAANMIEHYIVQSVFYAGKASTPSHWYVVFEHHRKWRYIHYVPGIKAEGYISDIGYNTPDDAISAYAKDRLIRHFGSNRTHIITKIGSDEFKAWDALAKSKCIQMDIINRFGWTPDKNVIESILFNIDDFIISNDVASIFE